MIFHSEPPGLHRNMPIIPRGVLNFTSFSRIGGFTMKYHEISRPDISLLSEWLGIKRHIRKHMFNKVIVKA